MGRQMAYDIAIELFTMFQIQIIQIADKINSCDLYQRVTETCINIHISVSASCASIK
jgi:hypothetical protein